MQTILQYKYMSEIKRLHRCAAAVDNTDNNKHNYIFDKLIMHDAHQGQTLMGAFGKNASKKINKWTNICLVINISRLSRFKWNAHKFSHHKQQNADKRIISQLQWL